MPGNALKARSMIFFCSKAGVNNRETRRNGENQLLQRHDEEIMTMDFVMYTNNARLVEVFFKSIETGYLHAGKAK